MGKGKCTEKGKGMRKREDGTTRGTRSNVRE
jgi:hypothetical protein